MRADIDLGPVQEAELQVVFSIIMVMLYPTFVMLLVSEGQMRPDSKVVILFISAFFLYLFCSYSVRNLRNAIEGDGCSIRHVGKGRSSD